MLTLFFGIPNKSLVLSSLTVPFSFPTLQLVSVESVCSWRKSSDRQSCDSRHTAALLHHYDAVHDQIYP